MMFYTFQGVAAANTSVTKYSNGAMMMQGKVWTTYFSVCSCTHVYEQNADSSRLAFKLPEQPCLECCVMLCVWRRRFLFGNRCLLSIPLKNLVSYHLNANNEDTSSGINHTQWFISSRRGVLAWGGCVEAGASSCLKIHIMGIQKLSLNL